MKLRLDFVTNSSSSSFIVAKKGELNDKQKDALINYITNVFLGEPTVSPKSTKQELDEFIGDYGLNYNEEDEAVYQAIKDGKTVYTGSVDFEDVEWEYIAMYEDIWKILAENGDGNFVVIDGSLDY